MGHVWGDIRSQHPRPGALSDRPVRLADPYDAPFLLVLHFPNEHGAPLLQDRASRQLRSRPDRSGGSPHVAHYDHLLRLRQNHPTLECHVRVRNLRQGGGGHNASRALVREPPNEG